MQATATLKTPCRKLSSTFWCKDIRRLPHAARWLLVFCRKNRVFALYGEPGSGKTTFIKAICRELGIINEVSSPSFIIVNEYRDKRYRRVYHMDFYRIRNLKEACDIGCEEYLNSGQYCFIEWPEIIETILPTGYVKVMLKQKKDTESREFNVLKAY